MRFCLASEWRAASKKALVRWRDMDRAAIIAAVEQDLVVAERKVGQIECTRKCRCHNASQFKNLAQKI